MFFRSSASEFVEFPMTNGRKLDRYRYQVTPDVEIDTPIGRLKTLHLVKQREGNESAAEVWLADRASAVSREARDRREERHAVRTDHSDAGDPRLRGGACLRLGPRRLRNAPAVGQNLTRKLLDAAAEALAAVLRFDQPADGVLSRYFREHHELGQHDRAFVAESTFGVLRHKRTLDHLTGNGPPRRLLLGWATRHAGLSVRDLAPALPAGESEWIASLKARAAHRRRFLPRCGPSFRTGFSSAWKRNSAPTRHSRSAAACRTLPRWTCA